MHSSECFAEHSGELPFGSFGCGAWKFRIHFSLLLPRFWCYNSEACYGQIIVAYEQLGMRGCLLRATWAQISLTSAINLEVQAGFQDCFLVYLPCLDCFGPVVIDCVHNDICTRLSTARVCLLGLEAILFARCTGFA